MSLPINLFFEEFGNWFSLWTWLSCSFLCLGSLLLVYLLNDTLLVSHFSHHLVSLFKSIDKKIDSLVKLVEVHFHIFFLTFEVFWFLIRWEVFKNIFILCTILVLLVRRTVFISLILYFRWLLVLFLFTSRIGIFLKHKSMSSLKWSSFNIFSGLWE